MKFTIYQESRIGQRHNNQDRIAHCYSRDALLMVLADGMGGHLHGEVAAQIAIQSITERFQREARPHLDDPLKFLGSGINSAHNAILDYVMEHDLPEAPRTTCVVCVIQDNLAWWAHVGDSRLYLLRDNRLHTRTYDHSRVQMLIDDGLITEEEALHHPERNRVYTCLGGDDPPHIDFSQKTRLLTGDTFVLCSDGFWAALGDSTLVQGYTRGSVTVMTQKLMDVAEHLGGENQDNLSVIAATWEDSYSGDPATTIVETQTMPLDGHTTLMEGFDKARLSDIELTDADIEKAINEIRSAINKYSK